MRIFLTTVMLSPVARAQGFNCNDAKIGHDAVGRALEE
jgi:hypothetical protein